MNNWAGHGALIGMTGSGKTFLGKLMAEAYIRAGRFVLVFDPIGNDWPGHFVTDNIGLLVEEAKNQKCCAIFVDESSDCSKHPDFEWIFTKARNWGHESHFISQRHTQVPPIIREQVERLYLFRVSKKSANSWAEEFAMPEIETFNAQIGQYEFVEAYRNQIAPGREKIQIAKA